MLFTARTYALTVVVWILLPDMKNIPLWQKGIGLTVLLVAMLLLAATPSVPFFQLAIALLFVLGAALVTRATLAICIAYQPTSLA